MIPIRYREGEPRVVRSDIVLGADHPLRNDMCPACDMPLGLEKVALVYVGPGSDPDDQEKAADGRYHTGAAVAVHASCAGATQ